MKMKSEEKWDKNIKFVNDLIEAIDKKYFLITKFLRLQFCPCNFVKITHISLKHYCCTIGKLTWTEK